MSARRLWVVSELYYPEETSTGHFLTHIAEGLAAHYAVSALCSQPTYSKRGRRAPARETRHGVEIHRAWSTTFDKDVLAGKLANALTISVSLFLTALLRFRRGDVALVVTNPPFLPFLTRVACALRGARCLLLIHDVYPETLIAAGWTRPGSLLARALGGLTRRLYASVARIVVLGRDMKALVERKLHGSGHGIAVIPHWGDVDEIRPATRERNPLLERLGLVSKFVVQYSGNMGRTHAIETVVEAVRRLRDTPDVHFLFIGFGAKRAWLEATVVQEGLANVTVLPLVPRAELVTSLGACDVALIPFVPGMAGISVPSRMYNVMAAGRPILAAADPDSELAQVVTEEDLGWVVPPGDAERLAQAVREARADREGVRRKGARARGVVQERFTLAAALDLYRALLASVGLPARAPLDARAKDEECARS
jgi:glycosyltransferase involved in cell wall biosynthesis